MLGVIWNIQLSVTSASMQEMLPWERTLLGSLILAMIFKDFVEIGGTSPLP